MKKSNLMEIIKTHDLVIPSILLLNYKKLDITLEELLFLALLMSYEDIVSFDVNSFSKSLGMEVSKIIELVSNLCNKKYINLTVKKENGKMKEYLDISYLYEHLTAIVIEDESKEKEAIDEVKIYSVIETELGRTLSPIEYETIGGWLNAGISEDLIKEALKEAVLNGVGNLKYIDEVITKKKEEFRRGCSF